MLETESKLLGPLTSLRPDFGVEQSGMGWGDD